MSLTSIPPPSFGVGKVLSDTFQVFRQSLLPILVIMGGVTLVTTLVPIAVGGSGAIVGEGEASMGLQVVVAIISVLLIVSAFAASVLIVHEIGHGRPSSALTALRAALSQIIPLAILSVVFYVALTIMTTLLIVPGIWIAAVWAATVPAIMLDRAGFGALGRSARLTKGYRWSVAGVLVVIGVIALVLLGISVAFVYSLMGTSFSDLATGDTPSITPPGAAVIMVIVVVQIVMNSLFYGVLAAVVASIYMRLKEIKEGGDGGAVAEVFN
jgi:hypothetical protein